ncbi:energy-coupling factor ABC transporter substrate-binding protein [Paenibacillus sp. KS-LC4]|uniref:energy-coupling factor ABC transporter substrate-binding protein n=1 Tax=Paenibacillus sp. KS-LC4 TaxID=2979727 RepID=UPI0030CB8300
MSRSAKNIWILAIVILLAVAPLIFINAEFGGADGAAEEMIQTIAPHYEPWASPLTEVPGETESMLFALQAAIGAGIIGYVIGLFKGKSEKTKQQ